MPGMLTDGHFSRTRGTVAARGSSGGAEGTPSRLETQGSGSRTASEIPGPHKGDRGTVAARGSSGGAEGTPSPLPRLLLESRTITKSGPPAKRETQIRGGPP